MYQVLYRKWRPKVFTDVAGQEHITKTLMSAVESGRVSHAYLFTGSRGTGKTSCAKILAKAVNCEHPVNGNPCNECASCRGIDEGSVVDVVEIDAASNNGVDNIRDLREETNYMPSQVKYRVYIIDEVHMLSTGAFNALLKTLEEPPEHVKFILATTEVHKLPATILSRCQRFDFKRISAEDIVGRLNYVAAQEGLNLTDDGAMLIARVADGGMRDALSLLDRCASYGEEINEKLVSLAAGIAGREHIYSIVDAINEHNSSKALSILNELYENSCDMERLFSELLSHLRNMMISVCISNYKDLILASDSEIEKIRSQAKALTLETVLSCMNTVNDTVIELKRGADKRVTAELALIKMTTPSLQSDNEALLRRISELERALRSGGAAVTTQPAISAPITHTEEKPSPAPYEVVTEKEDATENTEPTTVQPEISFFEETQEKAEHEKAPEVQSSTVAAPPQADNGSPLLQWSEIIELIASRDPMIAGFMNNSTAVLNGNSLLIKAANPLLSNFVNKKEHCSIIETAACEILGKAYKVSMFKDGDELQTDNSKSAIPPENELSPLEQLIQRAKELNIKIGDDKKETE